jgi:hypothetical protein
LRSHPALPPSDYGHPAAKRLWKQMKSLTLRMGGTVLASQFA